MSNMFYYDEPVKFHDRKDADGKPIKHDHPFKDAFKGGAIAGAGITAAHVGMKLLSRRKKFSDGLVAFHEKKDADGNPKKHRHIGSKLAGAAAGLEVGGSLAAAATVGGMLLKRKLDRRKLSKLAKRK